MPRCIPFDADEGIKLHAINKAGALHADDRPPLNRDEKSSRKKRTKSPSLPKGIVSKHHFHIRRHRYATMVNTCVPSLVQGAESMRPALPATKHSLPPSPIGANTSLVPSALTVPGNGTS